MQLSGPGGARHRLGAPQTPMALDPPGSAADQEFRVRVRQWLTENLTGQFASLRGAGGPGREHQAFSERLAWNRHLAANGWTCLGWPTAFGGQGATVGQ
jgi:alkylation response protein AidB-like acyl-CoA dehydrogenase